MPNLTQTRKRIQATMIGLLVIDAVAIAFLFSPFTASREFREHALDQARNDLQLKIKEVGPLMGMQEKLKNADKDLNKFYSNRLPERQSAIATELGKLAEQNRVRIGQEKFAPKASVLPEMTEVNIDANIEGDYVNLVKFINALERDKMFFIVNSLGLVGQEGGGVKLALKVQTFLRS